MSHDCDTGPKEGSLSHLHDRMLVVEFSSIQKPISRVGYLLKLVAVSRRVAKCEQLRLRRPSKAFFRRYIEHKDDGAGRERT
jgi:hypothetical protein